MSIARTFDELQYIESPPALEQLVTRTNMLGFDMASEPRTGALLRILAASKPHGNFLELGTGTGIATAWLLSGMDPHSRLTSVETNSEVQTIARDFFGEDPRLTLVLEDGLQFLQRQIHESYDLIFADAIPGKYEGLQACLQVIRPGGLYVIDDLLPQPNWPAGHAEKVPLLMNQLLNDKRFAVLPLAWASGIMVAVRRP